MNRYFRVFRQLLSSYLSVALAYRADFIQSTVGSLLWSGLSFATAILITNQTPSVAGMTRMDLLLLAAAYGVIVGTHHLLCSRGFAGFSTVIHRGELDGYLLKPFDTLTFLSFRNVAWGSALRVIGSIAMLMWLLHSYQISLSLLQVLGFLVLGTSSFFLIYSLYTICCTFLIWHPYLSNIIDFIQNAVGSGRYPLDIRRFTPWAFTLIYLPFLLIVNIPLRALTARLTLPEGLLYLLFCGGILLFSRWFWKRALWNYTGASG